MIKSCICNLNSAINKVNNVNKSLDIVIIPDGYTKKEMRLFRNDCQKFTKYLLNCSPYNQYKTKINLWGIEAISADTGTDIPGLGVWQNTILNTSFYTFDLERYLMTSDNKTLRNIASLVPYDQIYILVNSSKYGGGAIYNQYAVCIRKNKYEDYIFVHEFGHSFAGLGDEYFTSKVAYNGFYPLDVEPKDPNLTTLVNFSKKWKNMVDISTPIPTPDDTLYYNKIGAFEGGGYEAKGVFRPMFDCSMKSKKYNNFCKICKNAIVNMLEFITK